MRVLPALDPLEHRHARLGLRLKARAVKELAFERREEALRHRVVVRAADAAHLSMVREECRLRVAEFVRNWLIREDYWRADRFRTIRVIFADEDVGEPSSLPPTLVLNGVELDR